VLLELDGQLARGRGVSTDILEASGRAYLRALSNALAESARSTRAAARS
jgi:2-isopropylmalate synthase